MQMSRSEGDLVGEHVESEITGFPPSWIHDLVYLFIRGLLCKKASSAWVESLSMGFTLYTRLLEQRLAQRWYSDVFE